MPTRTNLCPNPALGSNTTGWSGGSRVTNLPTPAFPRATGYSIGTSKSQAASFAASGNSNYAISFAFTPTTNGVLQLGVDWYYFGVYKSSTATYTLSVTAGTVYSIPFSVTSYIVSQNGILWFAGCAGSVSCVLVESGTTNGTYFDGDTFGASWSGTAENSTSSIPSNVTQVINPTGLASALTFGTAVVTNQPPKVIAPTGITSQLTFGAPVITTGPVTVTLDGFGIPSQETFGTPKIILGYLIVPTGIPSQETFGVSVITPGPVTVSPPGISSLEIFGTPSVKRIAVAILSQTQQRPNTAVKYEMVCVSRIMHQQSAPIYVQLDPLDWSGLSYQETLSSPTTLTAGIPISKLTTPIIQVLKDMSHKACEIWLYRNGKIVFSGPWLNWQVQNDTLTLNAKDALGYLDWFWIMADTVFNNVDQFTIGKALIDQWQALDYGNFGIDTSGIGTSSVIRDATYLKNELDQVSRMLSELGLRQNGFDYGVDPATRAIKFYYPTRGVDRSTGDQAIIFDARNVTNTNVLCSAGPQDIASEGIVVGTASGSTNGPVYSTKSNLDLRTQFGRTGFAQSIDAVSEQITADAYAQSIIDARTTALLVPGPDVRVTPDADISMYDVGDTVQYELHQALDISGPYRIRSRRIVVSAQGQETVTPTFV